MVDNESDVHECAAWNSALTRIFPSGIPEYKTWKDTIAITNILSEFGRGEKVATFVVDDSSYEALVGCHFVQSTVSINLSNSISSKNFIFTPFKLTFNNTFGSCIRSFFRVELDYIDGVRKDIFGRRTQEVVKSGGRWVDRENYFKSIKSSIEAHSVVEHGLILSGGYICLFPTNSPFVRFQNTVSAPRYSEYTSLDDAEFLALLEKYRE